MFLIYILKCFLELADKRVIPAQGIAILLHSVEWQLRLLLSITTTISKVTFRLLLPCARYHASDS